MSKTKHHYVPRFYLKRFASQPRRINVYNFETSVLIRDASLKDQCQRPRFYGTTDDVENDLMKLETIVSPAIGNIIEHSQPPEIGSLQHTYLLLFAALQLSRTPIAADAMSGGFNKLIDLVEANMPASGNQVGSPRMGRDFAVRESLNNAILVAECWADLEVHLVLNTCEETFVTSDNPLVLYNKYCEGLKGFGTTGATKRGLQVFVPISPHHLVVLFDKHVYKVGDKHSRLTRIGNFKDLRALNELQIVNADTILLFSDWNSKDAIVRLTKRAKKYRRASVAEVEEFVLEDSVQDESLLKLYPVPLDVSLELSFVRMRRRVQSVPRARRAMEYRDRPTISDREQAIHQRTAKKYTRRDSPEDHS